MLAFERTLKQHLVSYERREGEGRGGREFVVCPRKKEEKSAPM